MTNRALFLDRDGVINVDRGYVHRIEDFELLPGSIDLLRDAQDAGFLLIVITNQSGLARGFFSSDQYAAIEAHMRHTLQHHGVTLTDVYHCPHHVDGTIPELSIPCSCRKPAPGLILVAAAEHHVDLAASALIGDKISDIEAGRAAGVGRTFLLNHDDLQQSWRDICSALTAG